MIEVGSWVRIIDCRHGHAFKIGSIVRVQMVDPYDGRLPYECEGDCTDEQCRWVGNDEVEELE